MAELDTPLVALFETVEVAEAAVKALVAAHFDIKHLSVVGRGYHAEEHAGFYTAGDRVKFWGRDGAFWGAVWGLLFGGLFMTIPFVGPVIVVGQLATIALAAIEGAAIVGGLSAVGAALYSLGVPKDSAIRYERVLKSDGFLVIAHGNAAEVERARAMLAELHPMQLDVHAEPVAALKETSL